MGGPSALYSYETLFDTADALGLGYEALEQLFRRMAFNVYNGEMDDHTKNFSFLMREGGAWELAPAYDLINTSLHLHMPRIFALDKGLFREGMQLTDTHTVTRHDFEEFGHRIGLAPRIVNRELSFFAAEQPTALPLITRSFLSESLKRSYWQSYDYRRKTLGM